MHNEFTYIVEPPTEGDRWYIAFCTEVPEANGQGETEAAAIDSLRSCIELLLDYRREEGFAAFRSWQVAAWLQWDEAPPPHVAPEEAWLPGHARRR